MNKHKLYGAILGDLAGQPYEFKYKGNFSEFNIHDPKSHITDDTVMTLASAYSILNGIKPEVAYRFIGRQYMDCGFGSRFKEWLKTSASTIGDSYGNGCLMRVSPFIWSKSDLATIINSVRCSHHNQISYLSVIDLWKLYNDIDINDNEDVSKPKKFKKFEVSADSTFDFCKKVYVHNAFSTKNCIITAIKCGGDTDTNASIVGELSNHYYGDITKEDAEYVESKLDKYLLDILHKFNKKFNE